MRFLSTVFAAVAVVALPAIGSSCTAHSQPLHEIRKYSGETSGRHIVKFRNTNAKENALSALGARVSMMITHDWTIIPGIAGDFDTATLETFRRSSDVEYIEEDGIAHIQITNPPSQSSFAAHTEDDLFLQSQNDAPWGLERIVSDVSLRGKSPRALSYTYQWDSSAGKGVDIYIIDTGVQISHSEFGGRARWGATFGAGLPSVDDNGHGTHVAGTAAGNQYGVAKGANIIAVKVLNGAGSGAWADVISGINWFAAQAAATKRPSVASMSLAGSKNQAVNDAVTAAVKPGVYIVVAAANNGQDASLFSPASAVNAITVAASDITDSVPTWSNFGAPVALYAPGVEVISSWPGSSNTATNRISGTSMATPHISGLVAYLLFHWGPNPPPIATLKASLQAATLKGVLTGVPAGTVNYLAQSY